MRIVRSRVVRFVGIVVLVAALSLGMGLALGGQGALAAGSAATTDFRLDRCGGFASIGRNEYFILEPGYRLVLAGDVDGQRVVLRIIVRDETKAIGGVQSRGVEERETADGALTEISRNYFAICKRNNSVIYFGENVDFYENGRVVGHDGSWLVYSRGATPGLQMPGIVLLGAHYFQEVAPRVAMDRAEIISMDGTLNAPAGRSTNVLKTEETTPLEPGLVEHKFYAPDGGLISDGELRLIRYGRGDD